MGIENGNSVKSLPCFRQLKVAKWQNVICKMIVGKLEKEDVSILTHPLSHAESTFPRRNF